MRYLGLDQALQTTGWAVYDDEKLVQFGHFTISPTLPIEERLAEFWKVLRKLHTDYDFDYLFYEDIQSQGNAETYKKLAYVQAAVLLWCYWSEVKSTCLSPSHWRSLLTQHYHVHFGKKRADQKAASKQFVLDNFQRHVSEDEADAICLTLAGIQERKSKQSAF